MGISVDSRPVQAAWCQSQGGVSYPVLADFHPKGKVAEAFGVFNDERGTSRRSVFIIDKEGIVRYKRVYDQGLPDPQEILAEVNKL